MTKEEKISALYNLMTQGVFTADELGRLITAIDLPAQGVSAQQKPEPEKTPTQLTYEKYISNAIASAYKSPSAVKFPPFDISMVKYGTIRLDGKEQTLRYIETYVDAPNSYGTMLREEIIIGIDDEFHPLFWADHPSLGTILGKSSGWIKRSRG